MVKIFSPLSGGDPLGATLANLGKQLFGDRTGAELNKEKLYSAQRENAEMDNLMRRTATSGAQTLGSDPIAQAILIGSGYKPDDFAKLGLMGAATEFGAKDPRTQNWQVGSGQAFDNTADAFGARLAETVRSNDMQSADRRYGVDQSQATERYKFGAEPKAALGQDGKPVFAPQGELVSGGFAPVMSETEQKGTLLGQNWEGLPALNPQQQEVLGARVDGSKSSTPRNYRGPDNKNYITYDGVTDASTGAPLPAGGYLASVEGGSDETGLTNSTASGVQQGILANNKLSNLLAATREVATKDPTNFGIPGFIKGVAQDASQIAQGMAQGLGYKGAEDMLVDAAQRAMKSGVNPSLISGVFDGDLSSLHTLSDLMVYAAAEALAGQSGRSVSDKDVQFFKGIVGDPQGWMMSQQKYLSKLTQIERILQMNQGELGKAQVDGAVPRTAAPAPVQEEEWVRGPDGKLQRAR